MSFIKEWTNKEVEVLTRSFKRYSAYVIILKYILPLTALCLAAALFIYPALTGKGNKIVLVAQEQKNNKPAESPVMAKPKFLGMDSKGTYQVIKARTPLAELDKYSTSLRSITQGRGNYTGKFAEYATVPGEIQKKLAEEYKTMEVH